jgi:type II secretory pathway pseudopilin PulG
MSYALRNTLILIGLLIIVLFISFAGSYNSRKRLDSIRESLEKNKVQLENLRRANPDMKDQDVMVQSLEELELKVKSESKLIAQDNNPTITYAYLLDIVENNCPSLKFDFKYVGSGSIESTRFNSYSIIGTGALNDIYTFIYQLENQFMLYVLESVRLSGVGEDEEYPLNYVYFTLVINAFYEENAVDVKDIPFRYLKQKNLVYNPFRARIHGLLPDEHEQRFIDINNSRMIGLTPNKVFLLDSRGKIQVLLPGDKIAFGYLDHINWEDQNAVFLMNETGVTKERIMMLRHYED